MNSYKDFYLNVTRFNNLFHFCNLAKRICPGDYEMFLNELRFVRLELDHIASKLERK